MIDPEEFLNLVIGPTLAALGQHNERLDGKAAWQLLLGIALQESDGLRTVFQYESGPALGFFQMEPDTHYWLTGEYLGYRRELREAVFAASGERTFHPTLLATNGRYATAIARVNLWRVREALPSADDIEDQARYWKQHWNTEAGAGTVAQYLDNWRKYAPLLQELSQ